MTDHQRDFQISKSTTHHIFMMKQIIFNYYEYHIEASNIIIDLRVTWYDKQRRSNKKPYRIKISWITCKTCNCNVWFHIQQSTSQSEDVERVTLYLWHCLIHCWEKIIRDSETGIESGKTTTKSREYLGHTMTLVLCKK